MFAHAVALDDAARDDASASPLATATGSSRLPGSFAMDGDFRRGAMGE